MPPFLSPQDYFETFTTQAQEELRSTARETAATLIARGVAPEALVVSHHTRVEKKGIFRRDVIHHDEVIQLAGWMLHDAVNLQGHDGDEWYQHSEGIALGSDGQLYLVSHKHEERHGIVTMNERSAGIADDRALQRVDIVNRTSWINEGVLGYSHPFSRTLMDRLTSLTDTR